MKLNRVCCSLDCRLHCQACSSNQINASECKSYSVRDGQRVGRPMKTFPFTHGLSYISLLLVLWMNCFVALTEGLQCYECLSLQCESGAVCDAIKSTMLEIFFPKRHFIHFDPNVICPENELPSSSMQWANLSKPCERSDSICLVSPIEVHTVVDGKKDGKQLETEYTLKTHGYLLGCASRRKLLEFPETINVRVEFTGRNETGNGNNGKNSSNSGSNHKKGENSSGSLQQIGSVRSNDNKKQTEIFFNLTNTRNGTMEFDLSKKTYKDGYAISKIYSHVFYIDQNTKNATRCYEDNCNDKIKFPRGVSSMSGDQRVGSSLSTIVFSVASCLMLFLMTS